MKKAIVYLLLATLLLTVTGCGLSKQQGFGELIILGDKMTREADPENIEEEGAQPVSAKTTVKIGNETKNLGETFVLRNGAYNAYISDSTEKSGFAETVKVEVKLGKQTVKPKVLLKRLEFNALKLIYDPASFGGNTVADADKITQVKVKGNITSEDWSRLDKLSKNADGTWSVIVPAVTDDTLEFGFVYWQDTDGDGVEEVAEEWAGGNPDGGNYNVATAKVAGIVTDVLGMKLIYDPASFGGNTVADADKITQVKVKGNITSEDWSRLDNLSKNADGTWSVIVPAVSDETLEFGFVYWQDTDGDGVEEVAEEWAGGNPDGGNYNVATAKAAGIILLSF